MGQKVNPIIFRMGQSQTWSSKWFSNKDYATFLRQDLTIKKFLRGKLKEASVARIDIERSSGNIVVVIHTAKPGLVIGRGGEGVEVLKKQIQDELLTEKTHLTINIIEIKNPNTSAELVLQSVIVDLEKRIPFRRAMKQAIGRVQKTGVKGVKVICSGRLNGAEIARRETLSWGSLPLHTIRADVDYSRGAAQTTYGKIGVKLWIYKGEKFNK
ncbi:MAG: 30S ribosomal protein S3 [Parcubacteria group bacterium GW2011_GWA2_38_13]|nr:MAG: 30S ribosomal protein S3 [Parcubacteria group bacterium GW2011_GWA2_38_13]